MEVTVDNLNDMCSLMCDNVVLQKGKEMNKEEFYQYIIDNFSLDGASLRLIHSILNFVETHYPEENEQYNVLCELLDGTIALTDDEIRHVYM